MKEWCGMCLMSVSVESEQVNRVSGEGWCGMYLMSVSVAVRETGAVPRQCRDITPGNMVF